jgi:uncharacterized protein YkwD
MITKIIVISALLVQTGADLGVKCFKGKENGTLKRAAQEHAVWMARNQVQNHSGWDARKARVQKIVRINVEEVCAESWPGQSKAEAAKEMFKSWYATRIFSDGGHWGAINRPAKIYGFVMARGTNGIWYACGIVGR